VERPRLSGEARRSLEERLRILEKERIPRLERELAASGDPSTFAALQATREESALVRQTLSAAVSLEELPHDPTVVELGDRVTVRRAGSSTQDRFTLVGELEARLDDSWVSVESPLGSALLGSRVGEAVEVSSPGGLASYEVLEIEARRK
jgi:transcription elongation factor GreA